VDPYPLKFDSIFKPKVWGGRNLQRMFDKSLPPGGPIDESWELADLGQNLSKAAIGPARGQQPGALPRQRDSELLGEAQPIADGAMMVWIVLSGRGRLTQTSNGPELALAPGGRRSASGGNETGVCGNRERLRVA
jgi:mannose-6-phosphate isomerase